MRKTISCLFSYYRSNAYPLQHLLIIQDNLDIMWFKDDFLSDA